MTGSVSGSSGDTSAKKMEEGDFSSLRVYVPFLMHVVEGGKEKKKKNEFDASVAKKKTGIVRR